MGIYFSSQKQQARKASPEEAAIIEQRQPVNPPGTLPPEVKARMRSLERSAEPEERPNDPGFTTEAGRGLARGTGNMALDLTTGLANLGIHAVEELARGVHQEGTPEEAAAYQEAFTDYEVLKRRTGKAFNNMMPHPQTRAGAALQAGREKRDAATQELVDARIRNVQDFSRLSKRSGLQSIADTAKGVDDAAREWVEKTFPQTKKYEGRYVLDNPEVLLEPDWWAAHGFEMVPQVAGMIATSGAVQALGKSRALAVAAGSGMAAHQEAYGTYRNAIEQGRPPSEALSLYSQAFSGSAALNAIGLEFMLQKLPSGVKGKLAEALARGGVEGFTESAEEVFQGSLLGEDLKESVKQAVDVFPVAALMGILGSGAPKPGGGRGSGRTQRRQAGPTPTDRLKRTFRPRSNIMPASIETSGAVDPATGARVSAQSVEGRQRQVQELLRTSKVASPEFDGMTRLPEGYVDPTRKRGARRKSGMSSEDKGYSQSGDIPPPKRKTLSNTPLHRRKVDESGAREISQAARERVLRRAQQAMRGDRNPQTRTEEFRRWFRGSKATGTDGRPLRYFHATNTPTDIEAMRPDVGDLGIHVGTPVQSNTMASSSNQKPSRTYGFYVRSENPLRLPDSPYMWHNSVYDHIIENYPQEFEQFSETPAEKFNPLSGGMQMLEFLKSKGHDSIVYLNRYEGVSPKDDAQHERDVVELTDAEFAAKYPEAEDSLMLFDSNQVKSAWGNTGEFSEKPGMMASLDDEAGVDDAILEQSSIREDDRGYETTLRPYREGYAQSEPIEIDEANKALAKLGLDGVLSLQQVNEPQYASVSEVEQYLKANIPRSERRRLEEAIARAERAGTDTTDIEKSAGIDLRTGKITFSGDIHPDELAHEVMHYAGAYLNQFLSRNEQRALTRYLNDIGRPGQQFSAEDLALAIQRVERQTGELMKGDPAKRGGRVNRFVRNAARKLRVMIEDLIDSVMYGDLPGMRQRSPYSKKRPGQLTADDVFRRILNGSVGRRRTERIQQLSQRGIETPEQIEEMLDAIAVPEMYRDKVQQTYASALDARDGFLQTVFDVGAGMNMKPPRDVDRHALKSLEGITSKMAVRGKNVNDPLRTTLLWRDAYDPLVPIQFKQEMESRGYTLTEPVDNQHANSTKGGYRDVAYKVRTPNGSVAEIQIIQPAMYRVKMGEGHSLYEDARMLDAQISKMRPGSEAHRRAVARRDSLLGEMKKLYDEAYYRDNKEIYENPAEASLAGVTRHEAEPVDTGQTQQDATTTSDDVMQRMREAYGDVGVERIMSNLDPATGQPLKSDGTRASIPPENPQSLDDEVARLGLNPDTFERRDPSDPTTYASIKSGPAGLDPMVNHDILLSARRPTAKKQYGSEFDPRGIVDVATQATHNPKEFARNVEVMNTTPIIRRNRGNLHRQASQVVRAISENYNYLFEQMPKEARERARLWYPGAHHITADYANRFGKTHAQTAGMTAALSTQKDWLENVSLLERILTDLNTPEIRADSAVMDVGEMIASAATNPARAKEIRVLFDGIKGKSLNELSDPLEIAALLRGHDQANRSDAYYSLTPEGALDDLARSKPKQPGELGPPSSLRWQSIPVVSRAVSIYQDGSPENISRNLGTRNKVRSFNVNILSPYHPAGHNTMDTHVVAAGQLMPVGSSHPLVKQAFYGEGSAGSSTTGIYGTYPFYSDALRRSAKNYGMHPSEFQSVIWEAVRSLFPPEWRNDRNRAKIEAIWQEWQKGKISKDEARQKITDTAGGFTPPSWGGPFSRLPAQEGVTSRTGSLHQSRLPGGGTTGLGMGARDGASGSISAEPAGETGALTSAKRGIAEAARGINEILGGRRQGIVPQQFNEESYRRARPHFQRSWEAFQQAGRSAAELTEFYVNNFGEHLRPYLDRFFGNPDDTPPPSNRQGRPDLANPGRTAEARNFVSDVDDLRNAAHLPQRRSDEDVFNEAEQLLSDRAALRTRVAEASRRGEQLSDVETAAAARLVSDEVIEALESDDATRLTQAVQLTNDWRRAGTEQARAFRQRIDPRLSPEQRARQAIGQAILAPTKKTRRRQRRIEERLRRDDLSPGERDDLERQHRGLVERQQYEIQQLQRKLRRAGVHIKDLRGQLRDPRQAAHTLREIAAHRADVWDMVYEYWLSSILSGPQTHLANVVGNAANMAFDFTAQRFMEATTNLVFQDADSAQFGEFIDMAKTMGPAFVRAVRNGFRAWDLEQAVFQDEIQGRETTRVETTRSAIPGAAGRVVRAPAGRALMAEDDFFKSLGAQIHAAAVAYRIARSEGLNGEARRQRSRELLSDLQGEAWQKGMERALELTFMNETGDIGTALQRFRSETPGVRWFLPFLRTPINIFKMGVRKTPIGMARIPGMLKRDSSATREDLNRAVAEQVIAVGGATALASLLLGDDDEPVITGSKPYQGTKRGERELAYRTAPPQSVRVGDQWYSYQRVEPFATSMATMVDLLENYKRAQNGQDAGKSATDVWRYFAAQTKDKTFMRGISDLMNMVEDPRYATQWAGNFASSFVPNIIRQPMRGSDVFLRETSVWGREEWANRLANRVVYQALPVEQMAPPPRVDLWGREVRKGGDVALTDWLWRTLSPVRHYDTERTEIEENLDRMILNWNNSHPNDVWAPQRPSPYYTKNGETVYWTDEEYHELSRLAGERALQLLRNRPLNYDKPTERDREVVDEMLRKGRRYAKQQLLRAGAEISEAFGSGTASGSR